MADARHPSDGGYAALGTARWPRPSYEASGRISALWANCSVMCAVYPVMRLITKIGVKAGMSKPMRW